MVPLIHSPEDHETGAVFEKIARGFQVISSVHSVMKKLRRTEGEEVKMKSGGQDQVWWTNKIILFEEEDLQEDLANSGDVLDRSSFTPLHKFGLHERVIGRRPLQDPHLGIHHETFTMSRKAWWDLETGPREPQGSTRTPEWFKEIPQTQQTLDNLKKLPKEMQLASTYVSWSFSHVPRNLLTWASLETVLRRVVVAEKSDSIEDFSEEDPWKKIWKKEALQAALWGPPVETLIIPEQQAATRTSLANVSFQRIRRHFSCSSCSGEFCIKPLVLGSFSTAIKI